GGFSETPSISLDGRFLAFQSGASTLVAGDTNGNYDIFVRDRQSGTLERVSVSTNGSQGNLNSFASPSSISADGRFVVFTSSATNLVPNTPSAHGDIFLRDRQSGTTELVSSNPAGAQSNSSSFFPSISGDGRFVAFQSSATDLVTGDTNGFEDVFVRDRQTG